MAYPDLSQIQNGMIPDLPSIGSGGVNTSFPGMPGRQSAPGGGLKDFMDSGALGGVGLGLQAAGMVAAPIMANSANKKGENIAAGDQRSIETAAMQIQDAVNNGQMRPEAAMIALQQLQQQAKSMQGQGGGLTPGQSTFNMSGGLRAGIIVNNVISNIQSKMQNSADSFVKSPLPTPGQGGSPLDPAGANEGLQNTFMRTKLRNYFLGDQNGIQDTPAGNMLKPTSPFDFIDKAQGAVNKIPKILPQSQLDQIGQF